LTDVSEVRTESIIRAMQLYAAFDDSNPFGSRKPSASFPCHSFCDAETIFLFIALKMKAVRTSET
jgi:hypothetical protein